MWRWLHRKFTGRYAVEMLRKVSDEEVLTVRFQGNDPAETVALIDVFLTAMQQHALAFNTRLTANTTTAQEAARAQYRTEHPNGAAV